ncbi:MAG: hypothetical protein AB1416_00105 [Actinomycetota bacterium]
MVPRLAAAGACALALGVLAGCGGDGSGSSATPDAGAAVAAAAPAPQVSRPTAPGEPVRPGPGTPRPFAAAVQKGKAVVVAFLMPGVADDEAVRKALRVARVAKGARGVAFFTYDLPQARRFGDLPELLDVTGTPTVVVIGRDRRVANVFRGLTDADIVRQAVSDAKDAPPA